LVCEHPVITVSNTMLRVKSLKFFIIPSNHK
jgi:hypothetical protein